MLLIPPKRQAAENHNIYVSKPRAPGVSFTYVSLL